MMMNNITVVGVNEDGCISLSSRAVNAIAQARVVAGHPRHMAWFPQFDGLFLDMSQGFSEWLNELIDESEEGAVVILASGDPLFYGIGHALLKRVKREELAFIPALSSVQLAFAKLALPWSQAQFISCHGRALAGLVSQMQQASLFAILTDDKNTPQVIAQHLAKFNQADWRLSVCEQLADVNEQISEFSVAQLAAHPEPFSPLNLIIALRQSELVWGGYGQFSEDSCFSKRSPQHGLISKQPVRHLALAAMRIRPADTVWDIGAGSGSIAIEAAKFCWQGQVFAIESNPECYAGIEHNIHAHSTDNVCLVQAKAPQALQDLAPPDAIFIGGSRGQMQLILDHCWQVLKPQGRLLISAVTLDTVAELYQWGKQQNLRFQVQLVNVAQTQPLANYQRYQAENPIHLFSISKPVSGDLL
ncbi:precorrin-6y C5,15-methyltransferase (decarboxylating) subunit CbiE [Agarivorans sp. QJM3NY_33]|uniref:precorrin-6y C5,15-methyltransferase (decarboxylating) subunit CbiE n=1 Tax=Agarivorans sp. QJM3NY_33 TaxID=3421432 RepID=UPI003F6BE788